MYGEKPKFHSSLLSVLVAASLVFSCASNAATPDGTADVGNGCGYPERVRDGLQPYQYFCLAKEYLSDFRLDRGKECFEKLKACGSTAENAKFISILENCYFPKHAVPKEALAQLNHAADLMPAARMGDPQKAADLQKIFRELVGKYPDLEWTHLLQSSLGGIWQSESTIEELKKVLLINPNNVEALALLAETYRGSKWPEAYECAKKAKELDPFRSGIDVDFYADVVARKNGKKEKHNCPEERHRNKERKRKHSAETPETTKYVEKAYKFIDKTGKNAFYVGPNVDVSNRFSDGLLLVNASEGRGSFHSNDVQYWNKEGDLAFSISYGDGSSASEGLCAVQTTSDVGSSLWGFVDHQGKTIIKPRYAEVMPFQSGLSAVKVAIRRFTFLNDKWGFVDSKGILQVEPIYNNCLPFSDGLAAVAINGKVGFINKDGYFEIPPKFDYARPFSEGLSNVMIWDEKTRLLTDQYIDKKGKAVFSNDHKIAKSKSLSDLFDISQFVYPEQFSLTNYERLRYRWSDFHDGLAARRILSKPNTWKTGFVNREGKFVIPPDFDEAEAFSEQLAKAKVGDKYGYINTKGECVIPFVFSKAMNFTEGLAAVSTDGTTWGYIDKAGKKVIEEKYLEALPFSEGLAKVGVAK